MRSDFIFLTYPKSPLPNLEGYIFLSLDAPLLTRADQHLGLFLIDGTWRHAKTMEKTIPPKTHRRSLPPHIKTAYPRRQDDCPDPERGLASIEALFVAYTILGRETKGLLDHYHWREKFILENSAVR